MTPAQPVGKAVYHVAPEVKPEAIVVHCSDPRFHAAFGRFVEEELGLAKGRYIPLIVGGGAGVLAHPEQLPKEFKFMKERFEFYREWFPTVRRIILINHEDCHYYDGIKDKVYTFMGRRWKGSSEHSKEDLSLVARMFFRWLSHLGVTIELYYGKFGNPQHTQVQFERLLD